MKKNFGALSIVRLTFNTCLMLTLLLAVPTWAQAEQPDEEPRFYTSPRYNVEFELPDSLQDNPAFWGEWVDHRVDAFLPQCRKWNQLTAAQLKKKKPPMPPCDRAVDRMVVDLVDDYSFFCGGRIGLCRGEYLGGGRFMMVIQERRVGTLAEAQAAGGINIRHRSEMCKLAHKSPAWCDNQDLWYWGDPDLEATVIVFIHEACHGVAGPRAGHTGLEECVRP